MDMPLRRALAQEFFLLGRDADGTVETVLIGYNAVTEMHGPLSIFDSTVATHSSRLEIPHSQWVHRAEEATTYLPAAMSHMRAVHVEHALDSDGQNRPYGSDGLSLRYS